MGPKILTFFLTLLAAAGIARAEPGSLRPPQRLFLAVGIGHYADPFWHPLKYAAKDAADVSTRLKDAFDGGETLASSPTKPVSRDDVLTALARLAQANTLEQDAVVVYVSGHGTIGRRYDRDAQALVLDKFVVTSTTRADDVATTGLSHQDVIAAFKALKSRRKVLIFDTCYSGGGKSRLTSKIVDVLARQKGGGVDLDDDVVEGSMVLAASAWGEEALESETHANGLYTHFLLEGFTHDANGDGAVTITEAHAYATAKVVDASQGTQHPSARIEVVGQDPVVVAGKARVDRRSPVLFAYEWALRGLDVRIDGTPKGSLVDGAMVVPSGHVRLTLTDPRTGHDLVDRVVRFNDGEEYSAAAFVRPVTPQSVAMQAVYGGFGSGAFAKEYLPGNRAGYGLAYMYEDAFWVFDVGARARFFPERTDALTVDGEAVEQRSSLAAFGLDLGLRTKLQALSSGRGAFSTSVAGGVGPARILLQRELAGSEFTTRRQASAMNGASAWGGLETGFRASGAKLGLYLESGAYQNPSTAPGAYVVHRAISTGLGVFW